MRKIIESPAGATHLGTAQGWLRQLKAQRRSLGLPMLDKLTFIGPFRILVRAAEWGDLIWIRGGSSLSHILLTDNSVSQRYDWTLDVLTDIPVPASATVADIIPIYDTRCQIQEYSSYTFAADWTADLIGVAPFEFIGGINRYEMAMFVSGTGVYGRIGDVIGNIASTKEISLHEYAGNFGSLFSLPTRNIEASPWNLFNGIYVRALNPASQNALPAWYWTPSLFTVQNFDPLLSRGWYYGSYPNRSYTNDTPGPDGGLLIAPLTSLKVSFRGLVDTRHNSANGEYNYGWAELVTQVDGADKRDVFIYLQKDALVIPSNTTASYVFDNFSNPWDETIRVGSDLEGFRVSIRLDLPTEAVISDIAVDMWNFEIWTSVAEGQQDTGVCAVVANGTQATVYRYAGAASVVYTTESYHSHSSSRDGKTIAIFDGADGIITSVTVLDLFGTQDADEADGYSGGGFTVIQADGDLTSVAATSGCVIPFRAADFDAETDPQILPYDLASAAPSTTPEDDFTDYLPSMSTMEFNKLGARSPIFHNVICENGIDAEFGISVDECFSSVIIQEDPNLPINDEKLIGYWKEIGSSQGVVRGDYSGSIPAVKFNGVGTPLYTSTLATMTMYLDAFTHKYEVLGNIGPVSYTGFDDDFEPIVNCDGTSHLTATSLCAQYAEVNVEGQLDALVLSGTDTPVAGSLYSASGGTPPYAYYFDGGTIDTETGEILTIDACGAPLDPRWATVGVTDNCSVIAEVEVRLAGGEWGDSSSESQGGDCATVDTPWSGNVGIFGGLRTQAGFGNVEIGKGCDDCGWRPTFPVDITYTGHDELCSEKSASGKLWRTVMRGANKREWVCP